MSKYLLAIDQGTTGTTVIIMNEKGEMVSKSNKEYRQLFPRPGWVEHDLEDIWSSLMGAQKEALHKGNVRVEDIAAIGITNQRETTVVWDKNTGKPAHNAIVWQDRRTADVCYRLKKSGLEKKIRNKTGLVLDPYFSGTKIQWILDHVPGVRKNSEQFYFGTIDTYLIWRLTGGRVHATDVSNASRTLLMNLSTLKWDAELCKILRVPEGMLPEIKPSIGIFGHTHCEGWSNGIPISGVAGDQQAALFGQSCFGVGEAKCTYGTGSFLLLNTGKKIIKSKSGCLTTVAWQWGDKITYALEGSAFICGAAVQWLRDGLGIIQGSGEIEGLASQVSDTAGVQFVPALTGLGAPHWNPHARGAILGLTRGTTKNHLARAALEGMALQNVELLLSMEKDLNSKLKSLKVDGGASANNLLMQIQSDFLGVKCIRPQMIETTSAGAAFMAGLGVGLWKSLEDIKKIWKMDREFGPTTAKSTRNKRLKLWRVAVEEVKDYGEQARNL